MTDPAQTLGPARGLSPAPAGRQVLGAHLRALRQERSLKLEQVATRLGVVPSTLSRIETGQAPIRTSYLTVMLDLYRVDGPAERARLVGLAKDGQRKPWWAGYDDLLPTGTSYYLSLEATARELRVYSAQAIPGLLQTPRYAAAAVRAARPGLSPAQAARLARFQARRQQTLHTGSRKLHLVIDYAALTRPVVTAAAMATQLERLVTASACPAVVIQVMAQPPDPLVLSPSFTLLSGGDSDQLGTACYHGPAGQIIVSRRAAGTRAAVATFRALAPHMEPA